MPIYEYMCTDCQNKFNQMRSFSDSDKDTVCPACGKDAQRLISRSSFYAASAPDSMAVRKDGANEKMWLAQKRGEDWDKKHPDPLKAWREEREKACGKGPEAWVEYADELKSAEQKKKDYSSYQGGES